MPSTKYLIGSAPSTRRPPDWTFMHWGPSVIGGNLYQIVTDQSGGSEDVGMMKSTDSGVTWTEMDSGNRPALADQNRASCSVQAFGTTVRVYHTDPTGDTLAITDFNTATDTWGTTDISAVPVFAVGDQFGGVSAVRRSTGDDVIFYQAPDSGGNGVANYVIRSGGVWGTPASVEGFGFDEGMVGCCLGAGGRVHFVYTRFDSIRQITLDASDVLGTSVAIDLPYQAGTYRAFGAPLVINGSIYIPAADELNPNQPQIEVYVAADADFPTFTRHRPADNRVPGYGVDGFSAMCMADVGGEPWLIFTGYHESNGYPNPIFVTRYVGGSWSATQEVVAPHDLVCYQAITAAGISSTEAGVVFALNNVLYFAAISFVSTPSGDTVYARTGYFSSV